MIPSISEKKKEFWFLVIVLCIASFLLLWNLGNQYLWQDEAETALVSKTILTYGVPKAYDGKNFFSQEGSAVYTDNYTWIYTPWFTFYLLAAFFKLFGISTFTARLPFALFGIGTILLTYFFAKSLFKDQDTAMVSALLLTFSVPFLIMAKQCRYYSPVMFFSVLGLYAYLKMIEGSKKGIMLFFLASLLLFHTNYIFCAILLLTVFLHSLFCHRDKLKTVFLSCLAITLINAPWVIFFTGVKYGEVYGTTLQKGRFFKYFRIYIFYIKKYIFPLILLLTPLLLLGMHWFKNKTLALRNTIPWKELLLLILFIFIHFVSISILSNTTHFRYLAPSIPIFYILMAAMIVPLKRIHAALVIGIIVLLIVFSPFSKYIYEITHDFDGPIEGIVKYLKENAKKDDVVAICYGDLPLKFYTDLRVVGALTGENPSVLAKNADFIILRKYAMTKVGFYFNKYLIQNVNWDNYQEIIIDYPDTRTENRESPTIHQYRTVTNEDKVVIFKKKE